MSGTLVDSSVLIDLAVNDAVWKAWSLDRLRECRDRGPLYLNQIVYAEVVVAFRAGPGALLDDHDFIERRPLPWEAAILAGEAHADYRRRGGTRDAILADFLIGAHALVEGLDLLTRDPRRVHAAFPDVRIIGPEDL